jgi:hypothetical protein
MSLECGPTLGFVSYFHRLWSIPILCLSTLSAYFTPATRLRERPSISNLRLDAGWHRLSDQSSHINTLASESVFLSAPLSGARIFSGMTHRDFEAAHIVQLVAASTSVEEHRSHHAREPSYPRSSMWVSLDDGESLGGMCAI